jgi:hypothetical protein
MSDVHARAWSPDPAEVERTLKLIEQVLDDDDVSLSGPAGVEVLMAIARLHRMGQTDAIAKLASPSTKTAALADRALASFDFLALDREAINFGCAAPDLASGGATAEQARPQVLQALAARDRADQVLTGAEALLGHPPILDEDAQLALAEFDAVVRPRVFQAIPLNEARYAALANVSPRQRARLWWFAQGAEISPSALDALAVAAQVIQHFPEAATELRELREAEESFLAMTRTQNLPNTLTAGQQSAREEIHAQREQEQASSRTATATPLTLAADATRGNKPRG